MREVDKWPLRLLAREATRNVLALHARFAPVVLAAVLVGSAHVAVAAYSTASLDSALTELEAQGRNIVDILPEPLGDAPAGLTDPAGVSRGACEALARVPGVLAAGVISEDEQKVASAQLGSFVPVRRVSPSLLPEVATHDVVVGTGLQDRVGAQPGQDFLLAGLDTEPVTGTVAGNRALPSTLAIFTAPMPTTDRASSCRVVLTRFADVEQTLPVLTGATRGFERGITVDRALRETSDVVAIHLDRVDQFLPLLLGVLGGLVTAILVWLRSAELATYRLAGMSPRSFGMLLGIEAALLAGVFLASSALAAFVLRDQLLAPLASTMWAMAGACAWVAVAALLSAPLLRRRPSDMAKDR